MTIRFPALASLKANQRGAAIIETGFIAPILAAMVVGMVQLGQGFSTKLQLEQASQRAIEKVMNGQADANSTTAATLKAEAATVAGVPEANVTVDYWLECNGARQADYATTCSTGQAYRRYLSVAITKSFTPILSARFAGANADGSYTLSGVTLVRTQ